MASRAKRECHDPTEALRQRFPGRLLADLTSRIRGSELDAETDPRDVMVGFAPFVDCARRLGVDPISLFDQASQDCGPVMHELATAFSKRTDVTLEAFGWSLEIKGGGECYTSQRVRSLWQLRR
jgi:hypothetical protein